MPRLDNPDRQLAQIFLDQDLPKGHPLAPLHAKLRESQTHRRATDRRFIVMGVLEAVKIAIRDRVYDRKVITIEHLLTASPLIQAATSLAVDKRELTAARRGFQRMVARAIPQKRDRLGF